MLTKREEVGSGSLLRGFIGSAAVLIGGTAFAQVLMVLVLPLLTRFYTPEDFGVLAVYTSILGIVSAAACLRFEIAIPLPESAEDAANLLALALCSSAAVGLLSAVAVLLLPDAIAALIAQPAFKPYLWLMPSGFWLTSSCAALQFWETRKKRFPVIARTKMAQAIGCAATQVGAGFVGIAPLGLLLGQMMNSGAGSVGLVRDALVKDRAELRAISGSGMRRAFGKYDRFPKYSTLESIANGVSIQLPVIMIAALAEGREAGFLMLASRVMLAPLALVGTAVSQVYLSRAPEELRAGNLGAFTTEVMGGLIRTGMGPLLALGIVAPVVFPLVFGARWQRAGDLVEWMTPWLAMQFLTSPVSMALHVTRSQRIALLCQMIGIVLRVGAVAVAIHWVIAGVTEIYALSGFVFYSMYLWFIASAAKVEIKGLLKALKSNAAMLAMWVLPALCLRMISWK